MRGREVASHWSHNPKVAGSIPAPANKHKEYMGLGQFLKTIIGSIIVMLVFQTCQAAHAIDIYWINKCIFELESCSYATEQAPAAEELALISEFFPLAHRITYTKSDCGLQGLPTVEQRLRRAVQCAKKMGGFNSKRKTLIIIPPTFISKQVTEYGYHVSGNQGFISLMGGSTRKNRAWMRIALRGLRVQEVGSR
jgi:hypothetical protein